MPIALTSTCCLLWSNLGSPHRARRSAPLPRTLGFVVNNNRRIGLANLATASDLEAYIPPSSTGGASELDEIQQYSQLLADSVDISKQGTAIPASAAASTINLLSTIVDNPNAPGAFRSAASNAFQASLPAEGYPSAGNLDALEAYRLDQALVNIGTLLTRSVTGRISTEVDPRLAYDAKALAERARALVRLYRQAGVAPDRLLLRVPATWQGIQAIKALEAEGISTHVVFVCSFVQAAAAAQAGASVVQVSLNRIRAWYRAHPNVIRDPYGPREDSGYQSPVDAGLAMTEEIFNFVKKHHPKTRLIVSGVRTREDALAVAGADYILAPAAVVEELRSMGTTAGYNDGLSGVSSGGGVVRRLDPEAAQAVEFGKEKTKTVTEAAFKAALEKGVCGKVLLEEGLERHNSFVEALRPTLGKMTAGSE